MTAHGQVELVWWGQSGFALGFPTARVLIDPFLSPHPDRLVPPFREPRDVHGFGVVACTHEHLDHMDLDALPLIAEASPDAHIVVPEPCAAMVVASGVADDRVVGMRPEAPIDLCGLTIHAVRACHGLHSADAYGFGEDPVTGAVRFVGYVIQGDGVTVYHSGDTIDYPGLADRLRDLQIDVALLPINGRDSEREAADIVGNLDAAEAAKLAADSGASVVMPMHYDMFAANPGFPERLVEAVRQRHPGLTVIVPARGVAFMYTRVQA